MKNHPRVGSSDDDQVTTPPRFSRERLSDYVRARPLLLRPLLVLRYVVYLALLFLRVPVQIVYRFATVPLFVIAIIWGFISGWTSLPVLVLGGGAFALFVFSSLFDTVLLLIAPEQIYLGM